MSNPFFDRARFQELQDAWEAADGDSDELVRVFAGFRGLYAPFIPYYQRMLDETTQEHKRKAIAFWISCLSAGVAPHGGAAAPPNNEFLQWVSENIPAIRQGTIPNLEKLSAAVPTAPVTAPDVTSSVPAVTARLNAARGIYFRRSKWRVRLWHGGAYLNLGTFKTEAEAIAARDAKVKELGLI